MKKIMNFRSNLLVLIGLSAFALFGIFGVPGGAQTMRSTKATPTPKKTVKATPKGMAPKKSPASTRSTPKPLGESNSKTDAEDHAETGRIPADHRFRHIRPAQERALDLFRDRAVPEDRGRVSRSGSKYGLVQDTRGQRKNRVDLEHRFAAFYKREARRDLREA